MSVVNSDLAHNETFNGRIHVERDEKGNAVDPGILITCIIKPGLNTITDDELMMLSENDSFEIYEANKHINIVEYDEVEGSPDSSEEIDITGLSVKKAGPVIDSVGTLELLDAFEEQESANGEPRKGIMALISQHREKLTELINAQAQESA